MAPIPPIDAAAVEAVVGLENAGLLSLSGPNAEGRVAAEIITDAYAKQRNSVGLTEAARVAIRIIYRECIYEQGSSFNKTRAERIVLDCYLQQHDESVLDLLALLTAARDVPEKLVKQIEAHATMIDELANKIPPPNQFTPQLMSIAISMRHSALAEAETMNNETPTETKGSNHGQRSDRTAN